MNKTMREAYLELMSLSGIRGIEGAKIWFQGTWSDLIKLVEEYGGKRKRDPTINEEKIVSLGAFL